MTLSAVWTKQVSGKRL